MIQMMVFALTVFIGWMLFDYVKVKKITKENVSSAFVSAIIAGIAYYVLYWVF